MSFVQIKSLWEKKTKINLLLVILEELKYKIQLYKHCPGCFTDKSEDHLRRSDL